MLVDKQIKEAVSKGEIKISPYDEKQIAPAAYYFLLGKLILSPLPDQKISLINGEDPKYNEFDISSKPYILKPNEFVLGQTLEKLTLANNIGMFIDGRTTTARLGLTIHVTASWIHPGHTDSIITLEIKNEGNHFIELVEGVSIAKGIFFKSDEFSEIAYNEMGIYPKQEQTMGADVPPYEK
jgi:dCTP deaminase